MQAAFWEYLTKVPVVVPRGMVAHLSDFSFHPPNGVWIPGNPKSSARIINSLRDQGFHPGVSDMVIAYPRHGWHGAFLELKKDKKSPIREEQKVWLNRMRWAGYFCELCVGLDEAIGAVQRYLQGQKPRQFPWDTVVDSAP